MVGWAMVLSEAVSPIFISWSPANFEMTLLHSVFKPMESHVDGFASVLFDGVIDDSICCAAVGDPFLLGLGKLSLIPSY